MALNCSFPKSRRLRKRAEYLAVQRTGKTQHCRYFVVVSREHAEEHRSGRLGITVSKKVGNAVTRNRVKRAVREFARQAVASDGGDASRLAALGLAAPGPAWLPANLDVVVIAKAAAGAASTATLWESLESCRGKLSSESARC